MSQDEGRPDDVDSEALRRAFAARVLPPAANPCPPADDLAMAALGQFDNTRMARLADHLLQCHACAEAWRLAQAFLPRPPADQHSPVAGDLRAVRQVRWLRHGAVAASVLLAAGLTWQWLPWRDGGPAGVSTPQPVFRDASPRTDVQVLNDPALPRARFLLRWTSPVAGARWTVRLFTADLVPVLVAEDVGAPALLVPPSALAAVRPGTVLLWQVEGVAADGARLRSATFEVGVDD
jgi:hypothetical protein